MAGGISPPIGASTRRARRSPGPGALRTRSPLAGCERRATSLGLKPIQSGLCGDSPKVSETDAAASRFASGARLGAGLARLLRDPARRQSNGPGRRRDWPRISSQVLRASLVSTVSRPGGFERQRAGIIPCVMGCRHPDSGARGHL